MFGNYSSIICAQLYQRYLNNKIFEFIQRKKPLYINFFFFCIITNRKSNIINKYIVFPIFPIQV